jgi:hypothetical protein
MSPMTGEDLLEKLQAMTPEERALYVVNESRSSNGDIVLNSNNVERNANWIWKQIVGTGVSKSTKTR